MHMDGHACRERKERDYIIVNTFTPFSFVQEGWIEECKQSKKQFEKQNQIFAQIDVLTMLSVRHA